MYVIQEKPERTARLVNGSDVKPLATLRDEYGGVSHIITDDHAYVLVNKVIGMGPTRFIATPYWYKEAAAALVLLQQGKD